MQMIKNNKGITLISLVITIIIMLILTAASLTIGYQSLNNTTDSTKLADIQMVQQAVYERGYLISLNPAGNILLYQADLTNVNPKPSMYLGEPLYGATTGAVATSNEIVYYVDGLEVEYIAAPDSTNTAGKEKIAMSEIRGIFERNGQPDYFRLKKGEASTDEEKKKVLYSDLYYVLDKADLKELGIDNVADVYVVNYTTGEVFNWSMKNYAGGSLVYLDGKPTTMIEPEGMNAVTEDYTAW